MSSQFSASKEPSVAASAIDTQSATSESLAAEPETNEAPWLGEVLKGIAKETDGDQKPPEDATKSTEDDKLDATKIGLDDSAKDLYEGPRKCRCCINWVEEYPDDVKESLEETKEVQRHALLIRNKQSHDRGRTMQIHSIVIQSPLLKKVFETVFEGYPGVTPSLQELQFKSPFIPFFHRMDRLEAELLKPHDVKTLAHVQLLYKTIKGDLQDTQRRLDDLIAHGLISFDLLWTIFNPGDLIFQTNGRHPELYRLKTITVSERYVSLTADYVDWNGSIFGYDTTTFSISEYEGNRRITNLSVYPLIYHADEEGLKERLLKRGKNFVALRGYQYKSYKEIMFLSDNYSNIESLVSKGTRQKIDGRIIIDAEAYAQFTTGYATTLSALEPNSAVPNPASARAGVTTVDVNGEADGDFNPQADIYSRPHVSDDYHLTDEQLILCQPYVQGFSLKTKKWGIFYVDFVHDIIWNDQAFSSLLLPGNLKHLIRAFVQSQVKHQEDFDDVIAGKGQGMVMLLTGDPGVGKTLTAEAVAEDMKAPLYAISAGDLGDGTSSVESNLNKILEMVTKWKAVLLIDECDVFMEARSLKDLHRNKLVAIFIRTLEYYRGSLFLTTNRVSSFDKAFQSRIHVTIDYPALNISTKRQIWKNFISGLASSTTMDHKPDLSESDLDELAKEDLNGRQIKNVVKTAQLLAGYEKKSLNINHIRTVLEVTAQTLGQA